ncbi:MAG: hypothetical protein ACOC5K_03860 [Chloroflexota bacterium]
MLARLIAERVLRDSGGDTRCVSAPEPPAGDEECGEDEDALSDGG